MGPHTAREYQVNTDGVRGAAHAHARLRFGRAPGLRPATPEASAELHPAAAESGCAHRGRPLDRDRPTPWHLVQRLRGQRAPLESVLLLGWRLGRPDQTI